jgi:hypothetical protein
MNRQKIAMLCYTSIFVVVIDEKIQLRFTL